MRRPVSSSMASPEWPCSLWFCIVAQITSRGLNVLVSELLDAFGAIDTNGRVGSTSEAIWVVRSVWMNGGQGVCQYAHEVNVCPLTKRRSKVRGRTRQPDQGNCESF
jgi:hypothetical protein